MNNEYKNKNKRRTRRTKRKASKREQKYQNQTNKISKDNDIYIVDIMTTLTQNGSRILK
jgi:hypothetical protein